MRVNKKIVSVFKFWYPSIIAAIVASLLFGVLFGIGFVPTSSMAYTIPQKSFIFMVRTRLVFGGFHRGDIITFQPSAENAPEIEEDRPILVKRIVGISGDTVEIKDGITYINGAYYDEPWLAEAPEAEDFGPYEVGEGEVFVMGDNRNNSLDSRYWIDPYVKTDSIIGKVVFVFSPFSS